LKRKTFLKSYTFLKKSDHATPCLTPSRASSCTGDRI
jgi:hypothetical protein